MLTLEFKAPTPPVSINKANRMHWGARDRALRPWKEAAFDAVISAPHVAIASLKGVERLEVRVHLPFKHNRRRDPHNYVGTNVKAVVDGLVQAGLMVDDSAEYVTVPEPLLVVSPSNLVVVYVKEAE